MPYDDDFSDDEPQVPATELQVTDLGSAEQPNVHIGMQTGREAWLAVPVHLKFQVEDQIRHILYKPKEIHFKGTAAYKTGTLLEARALVNACFSLDGIAWQTGSYHVLPNSKEAEGGIGTLCIAVATFSQDMEPS